MAGGDAVTLPEILTTFALLALLVWAVGKRKPDQPISDGTAYTGGGNEIDWENK